MRILEHLFHSQMATKNRKFLSMILVYLTIWFLALNMIACGSVIKEQVKEQMAAEEIKKKENLSTKEQLWGWLLTRKRGGGND